MLDYETIRGALNENAGNVYVRGLASVLWELVPDAQPDTPFRKVHEALSSGSPPVCPYEWGGAAWGPVRDFKQSPRGIGFDCSGLCTAFLQRLGSLQLGKRITSRDVGTLAKEVKSPEPGDLQGWDGHIRVVIVPGLVALESHGEGSEHADRGRVELTPWPHYRGVGRFYRLPDAPGTHQVGALRAYKQARRGGPVTAEVPKGWRY